MYKNYLFDVDGTLLPMDMKNFADLYIRSICTHIAPSLGVEPKQFGNAVWSATTAMLKNDGIIHNDEVFWKTVSAECGKNLNVGQELFEKYYNGEAFDEVRAATDINPYAKRSVEYIKSMGGRLIAATNPIFPKEATHRRLQWAGLEPSDFEYITVYDNSGFCKPDLRYYHDICDVCQLDPEESIMIGNDVDEDMCSARLGFDTYLITDCLINRQNRDISEYKNGSFEDFYSFLTKQNS